MILKKWSLIAAAFMMLSLGIMVPAVSAESHQAFRQENGLQPYVPPQWFLKGYFIAREKNTTYLFGPVQDFVGTLGGTTTWLIEDVELERVKRVARDGKKVEYSLFLEVASPEKTVYWVFVVLPHENAQAWYDARRSYHGRKAEAYYGKTRSELERALSQGFQISAELRFLIEKGEIGSQPPEGVIKNTYNCKPVFDLVAGGRPNPKAKTD